MVTSDLGRGLSVLSVTQPHCREIILVTSLFIIISAILLAIIAVKKIIDRIRRKAEISIDIEGQPDGEDSVEMTVDFT